MNPTFPSQSRFPALCACVELALLLCCFLHGVAAQPARSALLQGLTNAEAQVLSSEDGKLARKMIARDLEERLRAANARSTADWRGISSVEEWERFSASKIEALRKSLGQESGPSSNRRKTEITESETRLDPRISGTVRGEGYEIQNVVFQSRPGFWITANLYRPKPDRAAMPGIIISHAHHTPKEHGELQDMGVTWARAGCMVLVMDHLGHGERRQHPFRSAADFPQPFQTSRQDYYFRYDLGIQLNLIGESLAGWLVWDLRQGVDLLLAQSNVDPKRIILLGAVAGGGDPAAVAGALDRRISAVVPFNFGGPQPETRYPLPEDAETWFKYAGGGSWESTRNLNRSAGDGFLPWVIVGSIAPRRLVYGHEFSWDRDRDPVWKRLCAIYEWYHVPENLAFTHGAGELRGQPPVATHCTHIGPPHRKAIHAAFKIWFGIDVGAESSDRHPPESLRAMTANAEAELHPKSLKDVLVELSTERLDDARKRLAKMPAAERRRQLCDSWSALLGNIEPSREIRSKTVSSVQITPNVSLERITLAVESSITLPVLLLKPGSEKVPVVVAVSQSGKQSFLRKHPEEIAALLEAGYAICLPDVRGVGETSAGSERGRRSEATSLASTELMLGGTMLGKQLRDFRSVLAWLRTRSDLDSRRVGLWGDSSVAPNPAGTNFQIPRDRDEALPRGPEPLGGLLTLLAGLFEDDVRSLYVRGGLASFESVFSNHLVLIPYDSVVPGVLTVGDISDLIAVLPQAIQLERTIDGSNQRVPDETMERLLKTSAGQEVGRSRVSFGSERTSPAQWLVSKNR